MSNKFFSEFYHIRGISQWGPPHECRGIGLPRLGGVTLWDPAHPFSWKLLNSQERPKSGPTISIIIQNFCFPLASIQEEFFNVLELGWKMKPNWTDKPTWCEKMRSSLQNDGIWGYLPLGGCLPQHILVGLHPNRSHTVLRIWRDFWSMWCYLVSF